MNIIEVCRASDGRWYWHEKAANGRIVADSGQRFRRKWNAKRSAKRQAVRAMPPARIVVKSS